MPTNKWTFFFAETTIERTILLGYSQSQYTGLRTNIINTKGPVGHARAAAANTAARLSCGM